MPNTSMIKTFYKLEEKEFDVGDGGTIWFYDKLMHLDKKHYIISISSVININKE